MPDRGEPVLHVVIHLARDVAQGGPALGLTHAGGTLAEARRHLSQQAAERPDLVPPVGGEIDVETVQVDRPGFAGQLGERLADSAREPRSGEHGRGRGDAQRREEPAIDAAAEGLQRRERLGDDDPCRIGGGGAGPDKIEVRNADARDDLIAGGLRCVRARHEQRDRETTNRVAAGQAGGVERNAACDGEAAAAHPERVEACQREQLAFSRAYPDDGDAVAGAGEKARQRRLLTIELVAEVSRAQDASARVLDLKQGEAREAHRAAGVVEEPAAAFRVALHGSPAEPVVGGQLVGESGKTG